MLFILAGACNRHNADHSHEANTSDSQNDAGAKGSDSASVDSEVNASDSQNDAGAKGSDSASVDSGYMGDTAETTGCGDGAGKYREKSTQALTAAGVERTFVLYEPPSLDAKTPVPLVIVPHRYSGSGEGMFTITGYDKIADREGFVVAYPDGQDATWNIGHDVCFALDDKLPTTQDDIDQPFMNAIIEFVNADQCVDRDHIYITGLSMGGYFTHETACRNTAFRAAGPHSAGTHDLGGCATQHIPIIIFHFKIDEAIPYDCATDARDKWVAHNGCSLTDPDVTTVKGGMCEYYKSCPADGQVALCSFDEPDGGAGEAATGHGWSGGAPDPFSIPPTESASELGWAFFKNYAW